MPAARDAPLAILHWLQERGSSSATVDEIAAATRLPRGHVAVVMRNLEQHRLVDRVVSSTFDVPHWVLSRKGENLLQSADTH